MEQIISDSNDSYSLAKRYARHGAYLRKVKIYDAWVSKCFLARCPKCFRKLPGMLSVDGVETCLHRDCDYERVVYTATELEGLGR